MFSLFHALEYTKPPHLDDIPDLLVTIQQGKGKKPVAAIKRICELCDVGHKQNRVPTICSGKYDVLTPLAKCLTHKSGEIRHLACLALNNLSIPTENKRDMALGPAAKAVIGGLCKGIAEDEEREYHLCCICLMNISLASPLFFSIHTLSIELLPLILLRTLIPLFVFLRNCWLTFPALPRVDQESLKEFVGHVVSSKTWPSPRTMPCFLDRLISPSVSLII